MPGDKLKGRENILGEIPHNLEKSKKDLSDLDKNDLTPEESRFYYYLKKHNPEGEFLANFPHLEESISERWSKRTKRQMLARLVSLGYIELVNPDKRNEPPRYRFLK